MEGGRWKVEGGRWKVEGGRWKVEGGRYDVRIGSSVAFQRFVSDAEALIGCDGEGFNRGWLEVVVANWRRCDATSSKALSAQRTTNELAVESPGSRSSILHVSDPRSATLSARAPTLAPKLNQSWSSPASRPKTLSMLLFLPVAIPTNFQ